MNRRTFIRSTLMGVILTRAPIRPRPSRVSTRTTTIVAVTGENPAYVTCQETPYANSSPFTDSPLWSFPVYGPGQPLIGPVTIYYYPDYGTLVDSQPKVFTFSYPKDTP